MLYGEQGRGGHGLVFALEVLKEFEEASGPPAKGRVFHDGLSSENNKAVKFRQAGGDCEFGVFSERSVGGRVLGGCWVLGAGRRMENVREITYQALENNDRSVAGLVIG